ncbi:MAG: hypothetical protein ACXIT4_03415 [Erythrobacter sp.]
MGLIINAELTKYFSKLSLLAALCAGLTAGAAPAAAQPLVRTIDEASQNATYADLATLSDQAELVVRAKIRRQSALKPDRSPGLADGFVRLYIEARTEALISGRIGLPADFAYLVDVPLDARGRAPRLKGREVVLFARPVRGRPGELQLVSEAGQLAFTPELEARLRPILTEMASPKAPPRIAGISDALAVPGTLVGESETQIFLDTATGAPASLTILRRPSQVPVWGISWGEIIDSAARAPQRGTLGWFRLACSLPPQLPSSANLARDVAARRLASGDYAFVLDQLGPCERRITRPD